MIVAFAGRTVRNRISTRLIGDLNQTLGNERSRDRGAEQILTLIDGIGAKHWEYIIRYKFFAQIVNIDFLNAKGFRLGTSGLYLFTLPNVGGKCHHLTTIGFLQPADNDRSIEATRIGKHDFVDRRHNLEIRLSLKRIYRLIAAVYARRASLPS